MNSYFQTNFISIFGNTLIVNLSNNGYKNNKKNIYILYKYIKDIYIYIYIFKFIQWYI